ncbi:MAG TPA: trypsin-like peptidase domain-containing protein [Actinomycetota bacterium]|nr:trypsin-like peptidase domain-containing protein [Actinomycetota bacterium]
MNEHHQQTTEDDHQTRPLWLPQDEADRVPPAQTPSARSWRTRFALVLLVPLLVATGFVAGRELGGEETTASPGVSERDVSSAAPAPLPDEVAADEPVAAIAERVLPSVVQIDTGFGVGAGVIYDADGLIITAAHVVEGANVVDVRLSTGRRIEGRVLGSDPNSDIAVVRADASNLPAATLAEDEPTVGQLAVAIGSPFGLESTVTAGVVSAVNRAVQRPDGTFQTMVQTDAPINPGNSGGALVDRTGRVIGINDAIRTTTGGNQGVGFAVPIDVVRWVADRIINGEPVEPAMLGVSGGPVPDGRAGALVTQVIPGSPADDAGIREGDVITTIDGTFVESMEDLAAVIRSIPPGEEVTLEVERDDATLELTTTLEAQSEVQETG